MIKHITLLSLIALACQDILFMHVSFLPLCILITVSLFAKNYLSATIIFALTYLVWRFSKGMGFVDIIIMSACAMHVEIEKIGLFLTIIGASASIYAIKQKEIPLVPFILLAFIILHYL